ncbi:MAG: FtsX-like permease family protein [Bacteroidales bacterium]|nr:MAG: FtsX-like permease family protein [Bacteroidales bacterium]
MKKIFKTIIILVKVARESMQFAYHAISVNKLRTFLSLFGITIGIFAIISVFTILDSLEKNVRDSIQSLGDNVVYVQKWPWGGNGEYPWWKYMNRPQPNLKDMAEIRRRSNLMESSVFCIYFRKQIKYLRNEVSNQLIEGISDGYDQVKVFDIEQGRFFTSFELNSGRSVAILGSKLSADLFQGADPIGKYIKLSGRKVMVVGVFKKEGKSAIGENSHDEMAIIPVGLANTIVDMDRAGPLIMVKAKQGMATDDLNDELRGILRSFHKIKPLDDEDFALNQISLIKEGIDNIFKVINFAGGFIAFFSIVVGGFGIANIMFVSVKERTSIIGVQKALGAKRYFILIQFLYESVLLAVAGGIIGLLLIFIGTVLINATTDFSIVLTIPNIIRGLLISAVIGIASGFVPAWVASRLSPVEAINSKG